MTSVEKAGEVWSTRGQLLAASRHAAGLSQHRLASLADYSRVVRRTPCVGAALAAALEARAHAARGDTREAQCAPGRAESLLSALDAGSLAGSAFIVTPAWARDHEHWSPGQRGPELPRQAHRQPAAGSHWCRRPAACGGGAGW